MRRLCADFEEHGVDVIARVRDEDAAVYLRVVAQVVPQTLLVQDAKLDDLSDDELAAYLLAVREALGVREHAADGAGAAGGKRDRLNRYQPYPKQKLFHDFGLTCTERLLRAGNQQGKTHAGGMELAMHLTGRYPPWWAGRRFDQPIDAWAACDTGETTRDNPQRVLMGPPGSWGSGAIPQETIVDAKRGRGVADLLDIRSRPTRLGRHVAPWLQALRSGTRGVAGSGETRDLVR